MQICEGAIRITIHAVGRLKAGPETELVERYLTRCRQTGRQLGIREVAVREVLEARSSRPADRKAEEADALLGGTTDGARLIALDETGRSWTTRQFAEKIQTLADQGTRDLGFLIGGADGHGPAIAERCHDRLALGAMTWPHQLVRVLLAEQIYRALTVLSGHPYHRS